MTELIVDNFAGGGGASTGIEMAAGRPVNIAINHDPDAVSMHQANHPFTWHIRTSVWDVDPEEVCKGYPVGLAWFSPDCKHFSKAKGAALVDKKIRGLAWIVLRWAGTVRPRVIMVENVEEFITWGPVRKGKPVKKKSGQTFRKWKSQLEDLGYTVEHREIVAADLGVPTTRKRLVIVARCDGKPIVWPKATHAKNGANRLKPWVPADTVIDWSQPTYSIFESKQAIKEKYGATVVRPLKENTLRRIIRGVDKFTIKSGKPFLVECRHTGNGHIRSIHDPVKTVTQKHTEGILSPVICQQKFGNAAQNITNPLSTVTSVGSHELCVANLIQYHTEGIVNPVLAPITFSNTGGSVGSQAKYPVGTIRTAGGQILSSAHLIQYHTEQNEGMRGQELSTPIRTIDSNPRYGLASAHLTQYFGGDHFHGADEPLHTATTRPREGIAAVHLMKYFGGVVGADIESPLPTVTAADHNSLAAAHIAEFKGSDIGQDVNRPLRTGTTSAGQFAVCTVRTEKYGSRTDLGYWPEIRNLLNQYCGYTLADDEILLLRIGGSDYFLSDIQMRMLVPRELYRAMGFPDDYIIEYGADGKPYGKSKQVARCGNAVCPPLAEAMVRANLPEWCDNHPRKTYKDDFMEKFPKRDTHETEDWYPRLCRDLLYGIGSDDCDSNCKSCWESPMEEE